MIIDNTDSLKNMKTPALSEQGFQSSGKRTKFVPPLRSLRSPNSYVSPIRITIQSPFRTHHGHSPSLKINADITNDASEYYTSSVHSNQRLEMSSCLEKHNKHINDGDGDDDDDDAMNEKGMILKFAHFVLKFFQRFFCTFITFETEAKGFEDNTKEREEISEDIDTIKSMHEDDHCDDNHGNTCEAKLLIRKKKTQHTHGQDEIHTPREQIQPSVPYDYLLDRLEGRLIFLIDERVKQQVAEQITQIKQKSDDVMAKFVKEMNNEICNLQQKVEQYQEKMATMSSNVQCCDQKILNLNESILSISQSLKHIHELHQQHQQEHQQIQQEQQQQQQQEHQQQKPKQSMNDTNSISKVEFLSNAVVVVESSEIDKENNPPNKISLNSVPVSHEPLSPVTKFKLHLKQQGMKEKIEKLKLQRQKSRNEAMDARRKSLILEQQYERELSEIKSESQRICCDLSELKSSLVKIQQQMSNVRHECNDELIDQIKQYSAATDAKILLMQKMKQESEKRAHQLQKESKILKSKNEKLVEDLEAVKLNSKLSPKTHGYHINQSLLWFTFAFIPLMTTIPFHIM